jgi:superfamily II DNA or RNA helicase
MPLYLAITGVLDIANPVYEQRKLRKQPTWGVEKRIKMYSPNANGDLIIPRGYLEELTALLWRHNYQAVIEYDVCSPLPVPMTWNENIMLRPYQAEAVNAMLDSSKGSTGVLVAPAGSGKTIIGCYVIKELGRPALWLCHTEELLDQAAKAAANCIPDIGRVGKIGAGFEDWGTGKLIVATVQTLIKRTDILEKLNDYIGTVIFDECHHYPAQMFIELGSQLRAKHIYGLSATPDRKDKLEILMYTGLGPKLHEVPRGNMYQDGTLIKPEIRFIYTDYTTEAAGAEANVDAGGEDMDYTEIIRDLTNNEARAALVAKTIADSVTLGPAIILSASIRYSWKIYDLVKRQLEERGFAGVRMAVIHGGLQRYGWRRVSENEGKRLLQLGEIAEMREKSTGGFEGKYELYTQEEFDAWQVTTEQRRAVMAQARKNQIDLLFCTNLAREGLDLPHLCVGHMITPKRGDQQNRTDGAAVEQEIGRIMRRDPANPNKKAFWFDYVDYNAGIFQQQYYSRRSVYKRLGLRVPAKPRTEKDEVYDFLKGMVW